METENISDLEIHNLKKNRKLLNQAIAFFVILLLIVGSFWFGFRQGKKTSENYVDRNVPLSESAVINTSNNTVDFSLFWNVWNLVKNKHVNKNSLDAQKMLYGSIQGMLKATGDPYSTFFNPEDTREFNEDLEGSFEGIGAELDVKDNILTIVAPLENSPAEKAGLRPGDKILKIGDKISTDLTIDEAVGIIRGKKGTEVKLTILRPGEEEAREIVVIRDTIEIKSIKLEFKPDDIAYLKIIKFGETTHKEFDAAIKDIISKNSRGIILDLRNNPGGFLDRCQKIASRMIPGKKTVVIEEDYSGQKEILYTDGGDRLSSIPTVVLINEGSASASEILAAALRDNQGLKLIGKKTFGKGSVQQLESLPQNSSVKITVAKWLTPNGEYIMEKGILPDIEVDLTLEDFENKRDPQFDKALEILKEQLNSQKQ